MNVEKTGWKVVAISGVTNGGKTSLCRELVKEFPGSFSINQDDFFFMAEDEKNHVWIQVSEDRWHQNWERYESIDWKGFEGKIQQELESRSSGQSPSFLFIDGHVILNHRPFRKLFDHEFFLTLSKEECQRRRASRHYDPPDPPGYFEKCVWPMCLSNRKDFESIHSERDIIFLDGTKDRSELVQIVKGIISQTLSQE